MLFRLTVLSGVKESLFTGLVLKKHEIHVSVNESWLSNGMSNDEPPAPVLRTRILNPCTNPNLVSIEVTRIPFSEGGKGCPV